MVGCSCLRMNTVVRHGEGPAVVGCSCLRMNTVVRHGEGPAVWDVASERINTGDRMSGVGMERW